MRSGEAPVWSGRFTRSALAALVLAGSGCASGPAAQPGGLSAGQRQYSFWPPIPHEPRVQFLTSYRFSADVEPRRSAFDDLVFGAERQVLPIGKPYGVAAWHGRIYVCDITNPGVVILDLVKRETRLMGTRGVEPMAQPTDITVASDGMKYVVDRQLGRIFVFSAEDRHVATFGHQGFMPVAAAAHEGELYVADFQSQSIVVMDRFKGATLRQIGGPGGEEGRFIRPLGVEVDASGGVYVSDVIRGRLQKFAPDGGLLFARGEIADSPGNFVRPKHVAVDREGLVYVVDAAFQNVQMFNGAGELLMFFGSPGEHPGSMSLPAGIDVCEDNLELFAPYVHPAFEARRVVIVTNQFGLNKVAVYAMGGLKPGRTVADIAPYAVTVTDGGDGPPDRAWGDAGDQSGVRPEGAAGDAPLPPTTGTQGSDQGD
jgi:DNA-binding beta-propeller fold protein YncE